MATNEENDLIGYDPLAWMAGDADKNEATIDNENYDNDSNSEDIELSGADDYSSDLMADSEQSVDLPDSGVVEENITEEDDIAMDEMPVENDTVAEDAVGEDFSPDDSGAESQVDLEATLTIQNVGKLHDKLKDVFAIHDQIEINASDVSSVDTATLQLLVSLKKEAVKQQKQVTIIYPSPRFVESARLLGLADVLDVHDA